MSQVEIKPVDGLMSFLAFCKTPRVIYSGKKGFAVPLDAERWTLYAARLNPHYKSVTSQAWVAYRDGKIVGRIEAQVYKDGIQPLNASKAQFGSLDAIEDEETVAQLTATAEAWLKGHGANLVHGPFSPSVNSEVGMLVQGFDATPMIFMPWNPPYLSEMIERQGYSKARDLISYRYDVSAADREAVPRILARAEWRERLKIRTIDLKTLKAEAAILVDIFNDSWSQNWGFVPFTYEEFMSTADALQYIMPVEGGFMIELDGVPQAFGIVLPNLHEITADFDGRLFPFGVPRLISRIRNHAFKTGRLALFGIRQALQKKAIGGVVIMAFIEECRRRSQTSSIGQVEFGWVLEDNLGMRKPIEMAGAKIDKIHRIYEKHI